MEEGKLPVLYPIASVGVCDIPGCVVFAEGSSICYASGKGIASYKLLVFKSPLKAFPAQVSALQKDVKSITCMEISYNRRYLMAGERTASGSQIAVFETNSLHRICTLPIDAEEAATSCTFSKCGDLVACAVPIGKESHLFAFSWRTKKLIWRKTTEGVVTKVSFDPKNYNVFVSMTNDELLLWRYSSSSLKKCRIPGMQELNDSSKEAQIFTDHAWTEINSHLFVSTDNCTVFCIQDHIPAFKIILEEPAVQVATLQADGLITVSSQAVVHIYLHQEDTEEYVLAHRFSALNIRDFSPFARLKQISLNSDFSHLLLYIHHGEVFRLNLEALQNLAIDGGKEEECCDVALPGSKREPLVAVDMSIKMDRLVTASTDMNLRIWKLCPLQCEVCHKTSEEPLCLAISPMGQELVVSFLHSMEVYNIADGILLNTKCISVGGVRMMKYSPAGNWLALVTANGKDILVLETMQYAERGTLEGHLFPITDLTWSSDGMYLVSAANQALYVWSLDSMKRVQGNVSKNLNHASVVCDLQMETIVSLDLSGSIRAFRRGKGQSTSPVTGRSRMASAVQLAVQSLGGDRRSSIETRNSHIDNRSRASSLYNVSSKDLVSAIQPALSQDSVILSNCVESSVLCGEDSSFEDLAVEYDSGKEMQLSANCIGFSSKHQKLLAALDAGAARVMLFPPESNVAQDYYLHQGDVHFLQVHYSGELAVTVDSYGFWLLHAVFVPQGEDDRVSVRSHVEDITNRNFLKKGKKDSEVIVLPATRHQELLKELHGYKTSAVRSANEMAYRMKETTSKVRVQMMDRVREVEREQALLKKQMTDVEEKAQDKVNAVQQKMEGVKEKYEKDLAEKAEWMYGKLAHEIDRTSAIETNVGRLRVRYQEEMADAAKQVNEKELLYQEMNNSIETECEEKVQVSNFSLQKTRQQLKQELAVEMCLNEEEFERLTLRAQEKEEAAEQKSLQAVKDCQIANLELSRSKQENEKLLEASAKHIEEQEKLSNDLKDAIGKIKMLENVVAESHKMMAKKDNIHQDLMKDFQHAKMVNTLLSGKVHDMETQLKPLIQKHETQESAITNLDSLAVKDMSWIRDLRFELENLQKTLQVLKSEVKRQRHTIRDQECHMKSFQKEIWRVVSESPQHNWQSQIYRLLPRSVDNFKAASNNGKLATLRDVDRAEAMEELKETLSKTQGLLQVANATTRNNKHLHAAKERRFLSENSLLTQEISNLKTELIAAKDTIQSLQDEVRYLHNQSRPSIHKQSKRAELPSRLSTTPLPRLLPSPSENRSCSTIPTYTTEQTRVFLNVEEVRPQTAPFKGEESDSSQTFVFLRPATSLSNEPLQSRMSVSRETTKSKLSSAFTAVSDACIANDKASSTSSAGTLAGNKLRTLSIDETWTVKSKSSPVITVGVAGGGFKSKATQWRKWSQPSHG